MKAAIFIRQLASVKSDLDLLLDERNQIYDRAIGGTANYSGMPSKGSTTDRVGVAAMMLADLDARILKVMDQYWEVREQTFTMLHKIPDRYALCLRLIYICGFTIEEAGDRMTPHPVTVRHMYRLKNSALIALQEVLDNPDAFEQVDKFGENDDQEVEEE